MSTGPDWTIRIPGSEADQLTEQQRALLNLVEAELPASRGEEHDLSALEARVAPLIRALLSSGLTAEQIADQQPAPPGVRHADHRQGRVRRSRSEDHPGP